MKRSKSPFNFKKTSVFRLSMMYTAALIVGVVALLLAIYLQATRYLIHQGDKIILGQSTVLMPMPDPQLRVSIQDRLKGDLRGVNFYALFDPQRRLIAGNLPALPADIIADGKPRALNQDGFQHGARAIALHRANGNVLVVGYDAKTLSGLRHIMIVCLIANGLILTIGGLLVGIFLSRVPIRRLYTIEKIAARVRKGHFSQRLPISGRGDELDMLSHLVNQMLEEIQFLINEMQNVSNNIAHDLRTPLHHIRDQLYFLVNEWDDDNKAQGKVRIIHALASTDKLLTRFKALQRLADLDNQKRHQANHEFLVKEFVDEIEELFYPYTEDRGIDLDFVVTGNDHMVGDKGLLIEAVFNLIDNAFKFSPTGSKITLSITLSEDEEIIAVCDGGPGILTEEKKYMTRRMQRGRSSLTISGSGMGLAIVAAIARIQKFELHLENRYPGLCVTLKRQKPR
ncbi:hypothetical protein CYR55_07300 [Chimaeribacter californicus]|uniref:histidine kinase n=1 Tax=Chimaeribacter californicus TaxID=2060067 RepID=A0A2N5EC33_9GAMM|nr:HAMP domain-containing sensor histidine kinase [Chimaeribacter californicus]PLR39669.1 hypothetical protein CYR55_07300 [Chimaeribacter californicus]